MQELKDYYKAPVLAVLVSGITIFHLYNQDVNHRIRLLVEANKEVNLNLFYFSMSGVKISQHKINGLYFDEEKNLWTPKEFSFPDVLYLRGGVSKGYSYKFKIFMEILNQIGAKVLNYPRFNKWHLCQVIAKDSTLKAHMPATLTVENPQDIENMLRVYKAVYLKSHIGRRGNYVLRIEVLPDGDYRYSYYKHSRDELVSHITKGFTPLLEEIYSFFHGKNFIVQQAIDLMHYEDSIVDMRAELQRNGEGIVEIVGVSVRMGKPHSPITTHNHAYKFNTFFIDKMHYSKKETRKMQKRVNEFLLRVYECIEGIYGQYVEIGIDFAIDKNGLIWFIEANSQSTKNSLDKAYGRKVLERAYKNILEYALYVATQSKVTKTS